MAYAHSQSGSGSYRTARVTVGDVDQTVALSGTMTAAARRDLSFGVAGTVKTMKVAAGDFVSSGDTLATLDPTALRAAVIKAKATLAKAKAQLETDQSSQASTVTDANTPSSASAPSTSNTPNTSKPTATPTAAAPSGKTSTKASKALASALKKLGAQQAAVTSAQTATTDAISSAKSALARQQEACQIAEPPASSEPTDDEADGDGSAASADEPTATDVPDACATALDDVQSEQAVVSDKQDVLQKSLEDLSATITSAVKSIGDTTTTPSTATPTATPTDATGGTSKGSSGTSSSPSNSTSGTSTAAVAGGSGGTVTAATLAKDQASIDTAAAQLTEARRELASATLTAPFAGEILSVSVAKGDKVGASDVAVVIAGDGGTTVITAVTLDQIDAVKTGQAAVMTPVGASKTVPGTVSSIGLLPGTTTDSTTATYPVTIDLDTDVAAPEGSAVSIQLVVGTAEKALTVPSSAVSTTGRTTVTLLTDGKPVVTPVTIGVVGAKRTSVAAGLKEGQVVVIADLDAALPSGDSASTRLPGAGGGGMPSGPGGPRGRRS